VEQSKQFQLTAEMEVARNKEEDSNEEELLTDLQEDWQEE
jgi:hypothetical protein